MCFYLEDLAAESLTSTGLKEQFVAEYLQEANIQSENTRKVIEEYLLSISDNRELIDRTMAGLRKNEMKIAGHRESDRSCRRSVSVSDRSNAELVLYPRSICYDRR